MRIPLWMSREYGKKTYFRYLYPIDVGLTIRHDKTSMEISAQDALATLAADLTDRRRTTRFPVRQDVKYTVLYSKTHKTHGSGKTLNFGSSGILFSTEERLPLGCMVEISVAWPARLEGTCPLQFVASGRVVRAEPKRAAVRIERYEFKTRRESAA
jgi:hypothetical protein